MTKDNIKTVVIELVDTNLMYVKSQWRILKKSTMNFNLKRFLIYSANVSKVVCLGYCVGFTFIGLVGYPASVNGRSMQPTLNPLATAGSNWLEMDWVWVNCWRARKYALNRGDLVVYNSPKDPQEYLIKRLVADEGDTVKTEGRYCKPFVRIPQGHIWVEGDNWGNSVDSNNYGPVAKGLVSGVATNIIWPPSRIQKLPSCIPEFLQPNRISKGQNKSNWGNRSWLQYWKVLLYFIRN